MNDSLGDRMKGYENCYRIHLPRRMPVIIRIDGRAFHTFTRKFARPFDRVMVECMRATALELCRSVAGCKMAYTQSDEISLLITNDDSIDTQPWFDNNLQKLASITASIATLAFNSCFASIVNDDYWGDTHDEPLENYLDCINEATFDSRVFVLPHDEVCNYFIWRQNDASRNSIQSCAQSMFSHRELQGKNTSELQDMMMTQKNFNWNDLDTHLKRGFCIRKNQDGYWFDDVNIPVFTQDRAYIEGVLPQKDD